MRRVGGPLPGAGWPGTRCGYQEQPQLAGDGAGVAGGGTASPWKLAAQLAGPQKT